MDLSTIEVVRIAVGLVIMGYVGYCLLNQKVWLRGPIGLFSKIFMLHVIAGTAFGIWLIAGPFLF